MPAAPFPSSLVKQPSLFPRRVCARVLSLYPPPRGGRSADRRTDAAASVGACHDATCQALARRHASSDVGRSPLGAPPWRFSGRGPRFRLQHFLRSPCSELLAARSYSAWRAVSRTSRGAVTSRRRRTPHLAPPMDRLRKTPLDERGR